MQFVPITNWVLGMGFYFRFYCSFFFKINYTIICYSCGKECNSIMYECWQNCNGDALCDYDCLLQGDQCIDSCPCFSDCPEGCDGCSNLICVCAVPNEDPDYLICSELVDSIYLECFLGCSPGNIECVSNCARDYNSMIEQCPCQVRKSKKLI